MSNSKKIHDNLQIALIVGGKSKRFGSNKALENLNARALISYPLELASQFSKNILVACGSNLELKEKFESGDFSSLGIASGDFGKVLLVEDVLQNSGPLVGICSTLRQASSDWLITLPCDMPFLNSDLLELLYKSKEPDRPVFISDSKDSHYLLGIWHKSLIVEIEKSIGTQEFSIKAFAKKFNAGFCDVTEHGLSEDLLLNINTSEELGKLQA